MIAYEFYRLDKTNGCQLIGILPERRKNPERITEESVMGWIEKLLGDSEDLRDIFFVKVDLSGFEDERGTEGPDRFLAYRGRHETNSIHR